MVQGKITEADALATDNPSGHHPMQTIGAPASIIRPIFTPNAVSAATIPIYPGLG